LLSNRFEGKPVGKLFSLLQYDAITIGNHEFDFGPVGVPDPPLNPGIDVHGALKKWASAVPFPLVASNITLVNGTTWTWPGLKTSIILERQGVHVGVLGLTTPDTMVTAMPDYVNDLRFQPVLSVAEREAKALRAAGAEIVIALAHVEGECLNQNNISCQGALFQEVLSRIKPGLIDVVLAGHSHQCLARRFNGVFVLEACSKGMAVGHLDLVFDRQTKKINIAASRLHPLVEVYARTYESAEANCSDAFSTRLSAKYLAGYEDNPLLKQNQQFVGQVRRLVEEYYAKLRATAERVLTRAARPLRHTSASGISEVGTLFAQALLNAHPGFDFAVINAGGIRADLPSGPITYRHLFNAFPFDNRLASIILTGRQMLELIEHIVKGKHGLVSVAGLQLRISCAGTVPQVAIFDNNRRPLQLDKKYQLALNDFMLKGGDGLGVIFHSIPEHHKHIYRDRLIRDEIEKYLIHLAAPINTSVNPIVSVSELPIVFDKPPCAVGARRFFNICSCQ
jgi:5'-nucleotidase